MQKSLRFRQPLYHLKLRLSLNVPQCQVVHVRHAGEQLALSLGGGASERFFVKSILLVEEVELVLVESTRRLLQ